MKYNGIIYCYKSPSGKYYIGQTVNPKARRMQHKSAAKHGSTYPFHMAIRKYGMTKMKYKELALVTAESRNLLKLCLDTLEKTFILSYKNMGRVLYNCSEGGEVIYNHSGEKLTSKHRRNISSGMKKWHESLLNSEKESLGKAISEGRKKPILQFSLDGTLIKEWRSASDVPFAKQNAINNCLKGKSKTCAGFIWKYKDE